MSGSNGRGSRKGVWNRKIRGLPLWEEVASAASREKPEAMKAEEWALLDSQVLRVIRLTLLGLLHTML